MNFREGQLVRTSITSVSMLYLYDQCQKIPQNSSTFSRRFTVCKTTLDKVPQEHEVLPALTPVPLTGDTVFAEFFDFVLLVCSLALFY